ILPSALAAFRKAVPRVKLSLHDFSSDELIAGLHDATLELAVMVQPTGERATGIEFESLRTYPYCVAMLASHPFARLRTIPLEKLASQSLVVLRRKDYSGYHSVLCADLCAHSDQTANRGGMRRRQFTGFPGGSGTWRRRRHPAL